MDRAFERVEGALSRLEKAVQARGAAAGDGGDAAALRAENDRLQTVTEEVKGRLDGAIGRLEKVLEG
ncbi:MAG: hypothetical protein CMM77_02750 [Rhodospirillaceae bacterium]|nr:hypothetical protein [Rhodospirillaceae bacterium]